MAEYLYPCQLYSQNSTTPNLISFVAPATDIIEWAGVPAKSERFHGGFQRALGSRYKKIIEFFEEPENVSPTSVVIAFREDQLTLEELPYPSNWPEATNGTTKPRYGRVRFATEEFDIDSHPIEDLAERVSTLIRSRFSAEELDQLNSPDLQDASDSEDDDDTDRADDSNGDGDDSASQTDTSNDDDDDDLYSTTFDTGLDLGASQLKRFYDFISDINEVRSWLKSQSERYGNLIDKKANKERLTRGERDFLRHKPEERLRKMLIGLLRPAMIVDGQHRVVGAAEAAVIHPIEFTVCALPDADWVEQVFHFVIINKLGKPISSGFLTSILNTSLKNEEIERISPRLENVGIDLTDEKLMKEVNHNENSPFFEMVVQPGLSGANAQGKLSDKGMLTVAKRWWNLSSGNSGKPEWRTIFRDGIDESTAAEKLRAWREKGLWARYFFAFWRALRTRYEPDGLWVSAQGHHLLMIVTMRVLQNYYIDIKHRAKNKIASPEELFDDASEFFSEIPGTFFVGWKATGLQSGKGPGHIRSAVDAIASGDSLSNIKKKFHIFTANE